MAAALQSIEPSADTLRSEILLLSTYLDGQQDSPSTSHPNDQSLELFINISNLLAIGNGRNPRAQNVNAVMGSINMDSDTTALEFLICAENARQIGKSTPQPNYGNKGPKKKGLSEKKVDQSSKEAGELVHINPDATNGRNLLDRWDSNDLNLTERQENK